MTQKFVRDATNYLIGSLVSAQELMDRIRYRYREDPEFAREFLAGWIEDGGTKEECERFIEHGRQL